MQPAIERLRADPDLCPSFFDASTALALALFRAARRRRRRDRGRARRTARFDQRRRVARLDRHHDPARAHRQARQDARGDRAREGRHLPRGRARRCTASCDPEAWGAIAAQSIAVGASLEEVAGARRTRDRRRRCASGSTTAASVESRVLGAHQAANLALAHARARRCSSAARSRRASSRALESLELPARLERFGDVILDSAHTPDSARALRADARDRSGPGGASCSCSRSRATRTRRGSSPSSRDGDARSVSPPPSSRSARSTPTSSPRWPGRRESPTSRSSAIRCARSRSRARASPPGEGSRSRARSSSRARCARTWWPSRARRARLPAPRKESPAWP